MEITIFWILVLALFFYFLKESNNKVLQKGIGSFLIVGGLFIFNPFPSIEDVFLYPIFSSFMNWELSIEGIKNHFIPYTLWTGIIGLGIAWAGVYVAGFKINYLKNKIMRMFR